MATISPTNHEDSNNGKQRDTDDVTPQKIASRSSQLAELKALLAKDSDYNMQLLDTNLLQLQYKDDPKVAALLESKAVTLKALQSDNAIKLKKAMQPSKDVPAGHQVNVITQPSLGSYQKVQILGTYPAEENNCSEDATVMFTSAGCLPYPTASAKNNGQQNAQISRGVLDEVLSYRKPKDNSHSIINDGQQNAQNSQDVPNRLTLEQQVLSFRNLTIGKNVTVKRTVNGKIVQFLGRGDDETMRKELSAMSKREPDDANADPFEKNYGRGHRLTLDSDNSDDALQKN